MLNAIDSSSQPPTGSRSVTSDISAVNFMWYVVFVDVVDPLALALALALAMLIAHCARIFTLLFSLSSQPPVDLCLFSYISVDRKSVV